MGSTADAPPRPAARPFLTAAWRDLVMINHEVDRALLEPLVPRGTTLDLWDGRAIVSVVGFRFEETRVLGLAIPGHVRFEEVNLRFYVRREVEGPAGREVRRAVVFIRELVPRRAIAWVARAWYNEPYRALPMRHVDHVDGARRIRRYEWRTPRAWTGLGAATEGPPAPLVRGSEAEFITEHYWGYTRQRDGSTVEYRVEHPSWEVWTARESMLTGDIAGTYGERFAAALDGRPRSAFVAAGSPVVVHQPVRLSASF